MHCFKSPLILILFVCVIFSSCQHPEEPEDTTPPEIALVSPLEDRVKGDITIEARVEETGTGLSMQIFLDGNLLRSSSTGTISTEVDTETLSEGIHTIKITATDGAGNTSEKTFTINVRNILFKVHVSSNYIPQDTRIYFALSRNDGSVISLQEIENNGTMTVPTPADFNLDSSFVFTEYFYLSMEGFRINTINIYGGLNAGEFFLPEYPISSPITGSHHLKITDVPTDNYNANLQGRNLGSTTGFFGVDGIIETELGLKGNASDLFFSLTVGSQAPVYNYISNIENGGSTEFSLTGLPQMPQVGVTTSDGTGSYYYNVTAGNPDSQVTAFWAEGNFEDGKIPVYYPAASYPQYTFDLRYQVGGDSYFNYVRGATPPPSLLNLNAAVSSINYVNQKLKINSTGNYDIGSISGSTSNFDGTTFSMALLSASFPNGATNRVTIPNTPAEMLSLGFTPAVDFSFNSSVLVDYQTLAGSSDYQNNIVFSADRLHRQYRHHIGKTSQITPTGGRLSKQKQMALPQHLKTILKNHFQFLQ